MEQVIDTDPLPATPTWPERIEYEVNEKLGGDATVGEIVQIMEKLGWKPPSRVFPAECQSPHAGCDFPNCPCGLS
jgi:hypothetical protein